MNDIFDNYHEKQVKLLFLNWDGECIFQEKKIKSLGREKIPLNNRVMSFFKYPGERLASGNSRHCLQVIDVLWPCAWGRWLSTLDHLCCFHDLMCPWSSSDYNCTLKKLVVLYSPVHKVVLTLWIFCGWLCCEVGFFILFPVKAI